MSPAQDHAVAPSDGLGARLRAAREVSGFTLRETARRLGVSASFLSQLETGKSQPSVATLYSLTRLLGVTFDELFAGPVATASAASDPRSADAHWPSRAPSEAATGGGIRRHAPDEAGSGGDGHGSLQIGRPGGRKRISMASGVTWEQLVRNTGQDTELLEVTYPPHSSSTQDDRMLEHAGFEYGYLLEGELELTYGLDVVTVRAGESFGFDSVVPHLFRNVRDEPARFLSCNRHELG